MFPSNPDKLKYTFKLNISTNQDKKHNLLYTSRLNFTVKDFFFQFIKDIKFSKLFLKYSIYSNLLLAYHITFNIAALIFINYFPMRHIIELNSIMILFN